MDQIEQVAVLGAGGTMGFPIARNLARAGFRVRAWNRSAEKAQPLQQDGASIAGTPAEAADGAQAIVTMLADADAVLDVIEGDDGALARAGRDSVWVQVSTIGLKGTERCAAAAENAGVRFVDSPVLGTRQPAERVSWWSSPPAPTRCARAWLRSLTPSAGGRCGLGRPVRAPG